MGLLIDTDDFVGFHSVAQTSFSDLDLYIDRFEEKYLIDVLGLTLFNLFKADVVNQSPVTQIYLDLFTAIRVENNGFVCQNNGMKSMILGFVFGEYKSKQPVKNTASGDKTNRIDVAQNAGFFESGASSVYNDSVKDAEVIQYYIKKNKTIYPDYAGQKISNWHWSL